MSKRKLGNLFKRRLAVSLRKLVPLKELRTDEWAKRQFRDLSRFGGDLIVMQMGH
jgi:hypothetical protein